MLLNLILRLKQENFSNKFSDNVSPLFPSQMLPIKTSFREKISHLKSATEMASFLIVENASLATTYPDVCTAYTMYMTVPVTVATAERSFSKLFFFFFRLLPTWGRHSATVISISLDLLRLLP